MSLINVSHLTFGYEGSYTNVFEDVSFQIDSEWKLGFSGRNGRGKTTFLRLLMGCYPYSGSISAQVEFEYFPFTAQQPQLTATELIASIAPAAEPWRIRRELSLLEIEERVLARPYDTLSKGEQTKVMIAALLLKENAFLLIDEPTDHLDAEGREVLSRYLARKKGFILVSHDRVFLDSCIDHILVINKTDIGVYKGNFSQWWENKQRADAFELAENEKLSGEIKRLSQAAKRTGGWADEVEATRLGTRVSGVKASKGYIGHKSAKMMKRAKSIERRQAAEIEQKSRLLKNVESADELKMLPQKFHSSVVAEFDKLSVCYEGREIFAPLSFAITQGERIAVRGKNGSGKSSLLRLLCGEDIPHRGLLRQSPQLLVSYVPQHSGQLQGSLADYAERQGVERSLLLTLLRQLGFEREQFDAALESFSEGQKKKALLACSICRRAHLYVWDEPLNYIDVISRIQIEKLLLSSRPTLIFVEHDRAFCDNVATRSIVL